MDNMVALISLTISVIAIGFSLLSYRQSKKEAFQTVSLFLIEQKQSFLDSLANIDSIYKDADEKKNEMKEYLIRELAANYCNAYEHACGIYLNGGINKKLFSTVFRDEVDAIVNRKGIASMLSEIVNQPDCYHNITEAHKILFPEKRVQ